MGLHAIKRVANVIDRSHDLPSPNQRCHHIPGYVVRKTLGPTELSPTRRRGRGRLHLYIPRSLRSVSILWTLERTNGLTERVPVSQPPWSRPNSHKDGCSGGRKLRRNQLPTKFRRPRGATFPGAGRRTTSSLHKRNTSSSETKRSSARFISTGSSSISPSFARSPIRPCVAIAALLHAASRTDNHGHCGII